MSNLLGTVTQLLQGDALKEISKKLGVSEQVVQSTIAVGLPLLVSGLAQNATKTDGAQSLDNAISKDHDGSILSNVMSFIGNESVLKAGAGILNHAFGGKTDNIAGQVSKQVGANAETAAMIMQMVAPMVMGYIGKEKKEKGLDSAGVANMLQEDQKKIAETSPSMMNTISTLLDTNGDGNVTDDLLRMGTQLWGMFSKDDDKKDDKK